jgi:hypothetical protein
MVTPFNAFIIGILSPNLDKIKCEFAEHFSKKEGSTGSKLEIYLKKRDRTSSTRSGSILSRHWREHADRASEEQGEQEDLS